MNHAACLASDGPTSWNTPQEVVDLLHALWGGPPDLDPCSNEMSLVDARRRVILPEDGLLIAWLGDTFVNPPFDDLATWAAKAASESWRRGGDENTEIVLLMPARTDTRYWHDHITSADAICFWRGRMRFGSATASAPFPTVLVYWGKYPERFRDVFRSRGMVVTP